MYIMSSLASRFRLQDRLTRTFRDVRKDDGLTTFSHITVIGLLPMVSSQVINEMLKSGEKPYEKKMLYQVLT